MSDAPNIPPDSWDPSYPGDWPDPAGTPNPAGPDHPADTDHPAGTPNPAGPDHPAGTDHSEEDTIPPADTDGQRPPNHSADAERLDLEPGDQEALNSDWAPEQPERDVEPPLDPLKTKPPSTQARISRPPVDQAPSDPAPEKTSSRVRPAPPPFGDPPPVSPPALGTQGMPLPRRVDEVDANATRVSPSAYTPPSHSQQPEVTLPPLHRPPATRPLTPAQRAGAGAPNQPTRSTQANSSRTALRPAARPAPASTSARAVRPPRDVDWRQGAGCVLRMALLSLVGSIILIVVVGTFVIFQYYSIASSLPSVADLRQRTSQFETTRILDRNGQVLYEILDPTAGRRTYVPLSKISPYVIAATLATEDSNFYSHPGFDPMAILRAFWQNFQSGGETVSGASTITQQLVRALFMTAEERTDRSYLRKVREALLAAEVTRRYEKDEILELYLNESYYGNLAYGIEAAAETYFGTTADKLTLGQAAFLAGLPQAPAVFDVYTNRDATMERLVQVLVLMRDSGCMYISNQVQPICTTNEQAIAAYSEILNATFNTPDVPIRYPHWVNFIREQLEAQFDPQTIYRAGFTVYTTIDPGLQDIAQQTVYDQVNSLAGQHVTNGALVAIQPNTGHILAMVGSADFGNKDIQGEVNMATSATRQPGSSIKPITYLAAFEKGWTPSTLIWDVYSEFPPSGNPNDPAAPYKPVNYDERFHGPVTVRVALANSYNIPAVKALQYVGVYDNPNLQGEDGMIAMAKRLGITSLTRNEYGLALTLGGGEVSLLEMTGAYAVLANSGRKMPVVSITKIEDHDGNIVYEYVPPPGDQVVRAEHAYLISSILSDNDARAPMFGTNSILALPFQVAAKTGTSNDFRDNWTLGYTPDLAVGVWVGNADYTPMQGTTGLTGAAPIWASFMQSGIQKLRGGSATAFMRPAGIVDRVICAVSGAEPSQWCPSQRGEQYAADQLPLPREQDLWVKTQVDSWTGLRPSAACGTNFAEEIFALNVSDPWAIRWISEDANGREWAKQNGFEDRIVFAPQRECRTDDSRPILGLAAPTEGQTFTEGLLNIYAQVNATSDFQSYHLDYGLGKEPTEWLRLTESTLPAVQSEKIHSWDVSLIPPGDVTLRLTVHSTRGTKAELFVHFVLNVSTPTPTLTPTSTTTPTPTPTNMPSATSTPTPVSTSTPTVTQVPTETPTQVIDTPTPTQEPTDPSVPPATETPTPSP